MADTLPRLAAVIWAESTDQGSRWDRVHAEQFCVDTPNAWLARCVDPASTGASKPGRAVDVGAGTGRNAVWLAARGWEVVALDLSARAVAETKARAERAGVRVDVRAADLTAFDYGTDAWDLVVMTYMQVLTLKLAPQLCAALRPGGLFVAEAFHQDVNALAGRPLGLASNSLLRAYRGLRTLRYEDTVAPADWAHGEPARVVRIAAVKEPCSIEVADA